MTPALPEAQPGYRWELQVPDEPRRRHPGRWIVAVVVLLVLIAVAAVAAEWLAREVTVNTVRGAVVSQLDVPRDHPVDVEVPGIVLYQLAKGSLDEITVSSQDVTFGEVSGDVVVHAADVSTRGEEIFGAADATISLDQAQLRGLLGTVEGFPADSVGIAAPDVTMTYTLQALGVDVPVGVALQPSAAEGDLVLTPSAFQLGDAEIAADDLRSRFGALAEALLGSWNVCVAQHLPAGVTLTDVDASAGMLVATFAVDGHIADDPELRAAGTCD